MLDNLKKPIQTASKILTVAEVASHTRKLGADGVVVVQAHGTFDVKAGSLFPALHRLEQEGWIEGEWQESPEGRRVRSYTLTRDGRRQLALEKKTWTRIAQAMNALLESA